MDEDVLDPAAICAGLHTQILPGQIAWYAQVSSTMDLARAQLQASNVDSLLIGADEQTSGRGRYGRPWVAPARSALLFSLGLRPTWLAPLHASALSWMVCVALCEGITAATGLPARLKWPNDVLLPLRAEASSPLPAPDLGPTAVPPAWAKVAGVLLELSSIDQRIVWAVIGCGINVSANPPPALKLRYPATNLNAALGHTVARLPLLRALLQRIDHWYVQLRNGERDRLFATWRELLITLGREVQVTTPTGILSGWAEDVEPSGALRLRDLAGNVHLVTGGELA